MIAVLGEDRSDAETLVVIVKKVMDNSRMTVLRKGFSGCGELQRKAGRHLRDFYARGCTRFIICRDADKGDPMQIRETLRATIAKDFSQLDDCCIVVPIEELEAWLIADEVAIGKVFERVRLDPVISPERISDPKEWLRDQLIGRNSKPLYGNVIHNQRIAEHLNIKTVQAKCPSFGVLVKFLTERCGHLTH